MPDPVFELYEDKAGKFRFRLKAANGETIANSEPYASKKDLLDAVAKTRGIAPKAKTIDQTINEVAHDVKEIKESQVRQETHSNVSFYFGVVLGGLLGVIGNFFVSFWFQNPQDSQNIIGLLFSGILFFVVLIVLLYQARKYVAQQP